MSYELKIDPKKRTAGRFIGTVRKALISAALAEKAENGLTQQKVANCLGVNRSVVNRMLRGEVNLTLRSVAELAWAMGWEPQFSLVRRGVDRQSNHRDHPPYQRSAKTELQSAAPVSVKYTSGETQGPAPKNYYAVAAE